jgi:hypothetical protein
MPKYYSPNGNIEVWESKPNGYYTVEEWAELHPAPTPPKPTEEEQIRALDFQYNSDKAILMSQYTEADIDGDSDLKESIKAELVALREQYDSDYEEIVGGEE